MSAPTMNGRTHTEFLRCRDSILNAHRTAAERYRSTDPHWEANERVTVAGAANDWALAHGLTTVTVDDVERIEHLAVGHVDYMPKLALYVAEMVYGFRAGGGA